MKPDDADLILKVSEFFDRIGTDSSILTERNLELYEDADRLVAADLSESGRKHELTPEAACAWKRLKSSAANENISLIIVSAFRSFSRQVEIVETKINSGKLPVDIFQTLAPPGCSQHHTGRALDIGTFGCEPASESFAETEAYQWLQVNARKFGYYMPYGKNNNQGFLYEPWHWCFEAKDT